MAAIAGSASHRAAPIVFLSQRALRGSGLARAKRFLAQRMTGTVATGLAALWCLCGLIGSSLDESIAGTALMSGDHGDAIGWGAFLFKLFWVALANVTAFAAILALGYWTMPRRTAQVIPLPRRDADPGQ